MLHETNGNKNRKYATRGEECVLTTCSPSLFVYSFAYSFAGFIKALSELVLHRENI